MTSTHAPSEHDVQGAPKVLSVLLYSSNAVVREAVRMAVGRRPAADLPAVSWTECATMPAVLAAVDAGGQDVLVLDGEAAPAGGLGLCKQLEDENYDCPPVLVVTGRAHGGGLGLCNQRKDEIYDCPPVLVLTGRPQDVWLATWSRADFAVPHPLDPVAL